MINIKREELERLVEDLKGRYEGKEMTLLELDNMIQRETGTTNSLYEGVNYKEDEEDKSWTYGVDIQDEEDGYVEVVLEWEVKENAEDEFKQVVVLTDLWIL